MSQRATMGGLRVLTGAACLGLLACSAQETAPTPPPQAAASSGGESEQAAAPRPQGPAQSYTDADHTVVVRVDMTRVRDSAVSADVASLVRSYPMWQQLLGSSGIDPVRDFDRVLVVAPEVVTANSLIVVRHHLSNQDIRQAVLTMAVDEGERPQWREVEGLPVVDWPAQTDPPRQVVLTGDHELVVTTAEDLERVVQVALDQAARRQGDEVVEPALQLEDGLIANVVASAVGEAGRRRMRYPPQAFDLVIHEDPEAPHHIALHFHATYEDAAAAQAARDYYVHQRDFYAGQMLVRAVGLDRPLREAVIDSEGDALDVSASLTEQEIQRILGLVALGQLGGGGDGGNASGGSGASGGGASAGNASP